VSDPDLYIATVDRIEPDIHPLDLTGAVASIAISLKRIADNLDVIKTVLANPRQVVERPDLGSVPEGR